MSDPGGLYQLCSDVTEVRRQLQGQLRGRLQDHGQGPVLLCSLEGFVDAGAAGGLLRDQLLRDPGGETVAVFDMDRLIDYRSRRPPMTYVEDHWESYEAPELALRLLRDDSGEAFLVLSGPEPDHEWERFIAAVVELIERLGVGLTVSFHGIPMATPHTRPIGVTAHATRPELVARHTRWLNRVQVPASAAALLELRLKEAGRDAVGYAVHVPHYLSQAAYPAATLVAVDQVAAATGLSLPTEELRAAAERTESEIARQVDNSDELGAVVRALEQQYDSYIAAREREGLAEELGDVPTAEELGAQFEQFLADQERGRDTPDP